MKLRKTVVTIIFAILVLVGVIALSVCITWSLTASSRDNSAPVAEVSDNNLDTSVQDWVGNQETYTGEKNTDSISIPGFDFLNLQANTENQKVNFYNPPANSCYFKISLILDDETLWQSSLLAPGKAVYNIEMSKTLNPGEYNAKLKYECFSDVEATKGLNGSEVAVVLKVMK